MLVTSAAISASERRGVYSLKRSTLRASAMNSGGAEAYDDRTCSLSLRSTCRSAKPSASSSSTLACSSRSKRSRRDDCALVADRSRPSASISARSSADAVASLSPPAPPPLEGGVPSLSCCGSSATPAARERSSVPSSSSSVCSRPPSSLRWRALASASAFWPDSRIGASRCPFGPRGNGPGVADGAVPFHRSRSSACLASESRLARANQAGALTPSLE
mmetsp:Transcript_46467/g.150927  ORF Transcript_46467/g.150927 Transcript_46467/m.150927 type:complete len:219 (-) Transcript_46467:1107-1763(-)